MSQEIMTQIKSEGQNPFENAIKENDNSSSSSEGEQTDNDQTGTSDQNKQADENKSGVEDHGIADNPRWIERENDWKNRYNEQEQRHVSEISKLREEFLGANKKGTDTTPVQVPSWFQGDEDTWNQYSEHTNQLVSRAVEQALAKVKEVSSQEQKAIDEATKFFQDEVTAIESDKTLNPKGDKVDRNKLLKTVLENKLVDTEGRWNYRAAFKLMKPGEVFQAKAVLDERKKIANATTSENRSETKSSDFKTSNDFSKPGMRPW